MKIKYIIVIWLMFIFSASAAEASWNGKWHCFWKYGAYVMILEQHGNDVNGTYNPSHGILTGSIEDKKLHISAKDDDGTFKLTLTMGQNGNAFFGNSTQGDWIAASRVSTDSNSNTLLVNDSSPFNTFYSFLKLSNNVRNGQYEALEKVLELVYLDDEQKKYMYAKRLALTRNFFEILDACTVENHNFNETFKNHNVNENVETENDSVILHQAGTLNTVEVHFIKTNDTGGWKIKLPTEDEMEKTFHSLLKARESNEYNPNDNLQLTNPRATMRTFLEQIERWKTGGKPYVFSTMNLSALDPSILEWQAPLLSYYLLGVIDRLSEFVYQEIPNDPKSKKPYVHFHHPLGDIVIAPYEVDGQTRWQFTPETFVTIEKLFEEMEDIPLKVPNRTINDYEFYFKLKSFAKSISPLLIEKFYDTSLWQLILLGMVVFLAGWFSYFSRWATLNIVKRFYLTKRWTDDKINLKILRPIQILTFGLILLYGAHQLGLSDFLFTIIKTFSHLLIVIGVAWFVFTLVDIIITLLKIRAKKNTSEIDDIVLSLTRSILRIVIMLSAIFTVAEIVGIPYKTVVAGLGIGGLAFAIAAKDTIANFFGSAIIIADRPFKTGDKIKIGSDIGVITNVGIRSTRIRTIFDTLLTVPNNMITREMIDNYSEREAMRVDTKFFLSLDTSKEALDKIDTDIEKFLRENQSVDSDKIILTGVNDYTKRGIIFGLSFFVKASTDMEYSTIRHRLVTDVAQIIKDNGIELVMIHQEYPDET